MAERHARETETSTVTIKDMSREDVEKMTRDLIIENEKLVRAQKLVKDRLNRERVQRSREKANRLKNADITCLKEPVTDELIRDAMRAHFTVDFLKSLTKKQSYEALGKMIYDFICKNRTKLMVGQQPKNIRYFAKDGELVTEPLYDFVARICVVIQKIANGPEFRERDCYLLSQNVFVKRERERIKDFAIMISATITELTTKVRVQFRRARE